MNTDTQAPAEEDRRQEPRPSAAGDGKARTGRAARTAAEKQVRDFEDYLRDIGVRI